MDKLFYKIKKWFASKDDWLLLSFFFLLTFVLFFTLSGFIKRLSITSDEILYYDIARSIFYGQGIKFFSNDIEFQKILYSVLLSPFFAITNEVARVYVISAFNCLILASSIFPLWFIAKNFLSRKYCYILLLINSLFPYMLFSLTFMSEILYYPLLLWVFYVWILINKKHNYCLSCLLGVLIYACYLCKEVGVVAIIAVVLLEVLSPIIDKVLKCNSHIVYKKERIISTSITLISFLILFFSIKYGVFNGINFYTDVHHQSTWDAINSFPKFCYLIYGFVYSIVAVCFAVLFLPIIYPFYKIKTLDKNARSLLLLISLFVILLAAVISFTITVREETWKINNRGMTRYYGPVFVLFFLLYLIVYSKRTKDASLFQSKKSSIIVMLLFLFFTAFYHGAGVRLYMDYFALGWYGFIDVIMQNAMLPEAIYFVMLSIFNLFICGFVLLGDYLSFHKKGFKHSFLFFVITLSSISLIIGTIAARTNVGYSNFTYFTNSSEVNEAIRIDSFFKDKKNCTILYINNRADIHKLLTYDTYSNYVFNFVFEDNQAFEEAVVTTYSENFTVSDFSFVTPLDFYPYPTQTKIDYFIFEDNQPFSNLKIKNIEKVNIDNQGTSNWYIYKNIEPAKVYFDII
ncbi:MAG: hypothetical protein MJ214_03740 [Bacilli bacterium]|nr:hypothetical protein [Bacilli bacterium]